MPQWMSPLCVILGKNIQFGIMVFLEFQEINLQDNMRAVNVMNIVYFYENIFVLQKSSFPI